MAAPRRALAVDDLLGLRTFAIQSKLALSPDGRRVAYVISHAGDPRLGPWRVYVTDLVSGETQNINQPPHSLWGPAWNSTGDCLACFGAEQGPSDRWAPTARIYLWRPGDGHAQPLLAAVPRIFFVAARPRWHADGRHIMAPIAKGGPAPSGSTVNDGGSPQSVLVFRSPETKFMDQAGALPAGTIGAVDVQSGAVETVASGPSPYDVYPSPGGMGFLWIESPTRPDITRWAFEQNLHYSDPGGRDHTLVKLATDQRVRPPRWSPDGKRFAVVHEGAVLVWPAEDVAGPTKLSPGEQAAVQGDALFWTADGAAVVVWGGRRLWRLPVDGAPGEPVGLRGRAIAGLLHREDCGWLPPGEWIVFTRHDDAGRQGLHCLPSGECLLEDEVRVEGQPFSQMVTHLADVTSDGSVFVYAQGDETDPGNLWAATGGGRVRRQITDLNPQLRDVALGHRRRFTFRTTGGQMAGAGILLPPDWEPGRPCPMVVSVYPGSHPSVDIHGYGKGAILDHQLLASRGFAVLTPDLPYDPGIRGDPAAAAADGALPAVEEAVRLGYADPGRLAIEGQSYGGYAVLSTIIRTDRFRAAISASGTANLVSAYGSMYGDDRSRTVSAYGVQWAESTQAGMGAPPWERPLRYLDNSPAFFLDRIRTPLLLIAGGRDYAVPWLQSGEVFVGMRRLERTCTFLLYPDEGHVPIDFAQANRLDLVQRVLAFLEEHVGLPRGT